MYSCGLRDKSLAEVPVEELQSRMKVHGGLPRGGRRSHPCRMTLY